MGSPRPRPHPPSQGRSLDRIEIPQLNHVHAVLLDQAEGLELGGRVNDAGENKVVQHQVAIMGFTTRPLSRTSAKVYLLRPIVGYKQFPCAVRRDLKLGVPRRQSLAASGREALC